MLDAVPPLAGRSPATLARSGRGGATAPTTGADPSTARPALAAALDAGARAAQDLARRGVELHFEVDHGRIRIQVRDGQGRVIREVPPGRLLDVLGSGSGDGL